MNISNTTLVGIARLLVLAACMVGWLTGKLSIGEAALAMTTLIGALGSVGFFAAKDQAAPDTLATVTAKEKGGKVEVNIAAEGDHDTR